MIKIPCRQDLVVDEQRQGGYELRLEYFAVTSFNLSLEIALELARTLNRPHSSLPSDHRQN